RPGASPHAGDVDLLFTGLLLTSLFVLALLFSLLLTFAIRYRANSDADRGDRIQKGWRWEIGWTTVTFVVFLVLFAWAASLVLNLYAPPSDALPIYIVAKQWMWKAQHPGGQREINELHILVHRPVRLIIASQDVIHSFFIPAFRLKRDVVPGRYQDLWFEPDKAGLATPQGDLVSSDVYNRLFTMHGIVMVWFFLIPSIPATLGNFLVPLMAGARDLAFPRVNLTSWYLFMAGGAITLYAIFAGGLDTGWTFYAPFSTLYSNGHVVLAATGVFIAGFGSILTGLNFIVTIHPMRAPGLTWYRLPIFIWSLYATSVILVLATPVLAMALLLIALERIFGVGVFDPRLGGDPLLFQHLFWFYSHPAVYIMILPGMGVVSE